VTEYGQQGGGQPVAVNGRHLLQADLTGPTVGFQPETERAGRPLELAADPTDRTGRAATQPPASQVEAPTEVARRGTEAHW
jgi:hypothetical protein